MRRKIEFAWRVTRDVLVMAGMGSIGAFFSHASHAHAGWMAAGIVTLWYFAYLMRKSYEDARAVPLSAKPRDPGGMPLPKAAAHRPDLPIIKIGAAAEDVRAALVNLDYRRSAARRAVRLAIAAGATDFESIFRVAQRELAR